MSRTAALRDQWTPGIIWIAGDSLVDPNHYNGCFARDGAAFSRLVPGDWDNPHKIATASGGKVTCQVRTIVGTSGGDLRELAATFNALCLPPWPSALVVSDSAIHAMTIDGSETASATCVLDTTGGIIDTDGVESISEVAGGFRDSEGVYIKQGTNITANGQAIVEDGVLTGVYFSGTDPGTGGQFYASWNDRGSGYTDAAATIYPDSWTKHAKSMLLAIWDATAKRPIHVFWCSPWSEHIGQPPHTTAQITIGGVSKDLDEWMAYLLAEYATSLGMEDYFHWVDLTDIDDIALAKGLDLTLDCEGETNIFTSATTITPWTSQTQYPAPDHVDVLYLLKYTSALRNDDPIPWTSIITNMTDTEIATQENGDTVTGGYFRIGYKYGSTYDIFHPNTYGHLLIAGKLATAFASVMDAAPSSRSAIGSARSAIGTARSAV